MTILLQSAKYAFSKARNKETEINELLSKPEVDLWKLRELCISEGGLINDTCRKKAWPKLVGLDLSGGTTRTTTTNNEDSKCKTKRDTISTELSDLIEVVDPSSITTKGFKNQIMAKCLDAKQIEQDTARCSWHLLTGSQRSRRRQMRNKHRKKIAAILKRKQIRLENLINLVLIQSYGSDESNHNNNETLRYYQGYHDITSIIMSALGGTAFTRSLSNPCESTTTEKKDQHKILASAARETAQAMGLDLPSQVLLQISYSHLKDAMKTNFDVLSSALRLMIMPLVAVFDSEVHSHLWDCDMEPFFALSWIITWFSHDVRDTALVKRLFDFFIASHPLMPVYMSIAMILHPYNRLEVLGADCDFACVHNTLAQLPRNSCDVGWKLIGGGLEGNYVSGDEEDDDELMSLDGASMVSNDGEQEYWVDEGSNAPSLTSATIASADMIRAPFEEIIDLSIEFMRRIPPRNLMNLAQRYFIDSNSQQLLSISSSIALLQPPPRWALASSVSSDWVLRKQARDRRVGIAEQKSESEIGFDSSHRQQTTIHDYQDGKILKLIGKNEASIRTIIAAGIGPDGQEERRRARKQLKIMKLSALVVVMAMGLSYISTSPNLLPKATLWKEREGDPSIANQKERQKESRKTLEKKNEIKTEPPKKKYSRAPVKKEVKSSSFDNSPSKEDRNPSKQTTIPITNVSTAQGEDNKKRTNPSSRQNNDSSTQDNLLKKIFSTPTEDIDESTVPDSAGKSEPQEVSNSSTQDNLLKKMFSSKTEENQEDTIPITKPSQPKEPDVPTQDTLFQMMFSTKTEESQEDTIPVTKSPQPKEPDIPTQDTLFQKMFTSYTEDDQESTLPTNAEELTKLKTISVPPQDSLLKKMFSSSQPEDSQQGTAINVDKSSPSQVADITIVDTNNKINTEKNETRSTDRRKEDDDPKALDSEKKGPGRRILYLLRHPAQLRNIRIIHRLETMLRRLFHEGHPVRITFEKMIVPIVHHWRIMKDTIQDCHLLATVADESLVLSFHQCLMRESIHLIQERAKLITSKHKHKRIKPRMLLKRLGELAKGALDQEAEGITL